MILIARYEASQSSDLSGGSRGTDAGKTGQSEVKTRPLEFNC